MRTPRILILLSTLALSVASAAYHRVTFTDPVWLGQTELKPGDYRVQVEGDKAVIRGNKSAVEVPVKVETVPTKYYSTAWRTKDVGGKLELMEIRWGGTHDKITLQPNLAKPSGS